MTNTWGYRIIAHHDGDDTTYGLHEVSYADGVPSVSSHALLVSDTRDFIGVFRQLEDAVARPLLDPAKPEKTPRSLSHVQRARQLSPWVGLPCRAKHLLAQVQTAVDIARKRAETRGIARVLCCCRRAHVGR